MDTAMAAPVGMSSTAASASPGRRTVRDCTSQSYCSKRGRREVMLGAATRARRISRTEGSSSPANSGVGVGTG